MNQPLPEEERLARQRARRRAWNEAHPGYYAEYRERNREVIREKNRNHMRDVYQKEKAAEEQRKKAVERAGEWAKANPQKRQEQRERYKAQHPEKYRAAQREYYHRNKDAIQARRQERELRDPEKARETRRRDQEKWFSKQTTGRRKPTPEQREKYRAQTAEKRALERRLQSAGLPPRRLRRTLTAERRANVAEAESFFSRARSRAELRRVSEGDLAPDLVQGWAQYSTLIRRRAEFRAAIQAHIDKHGRELRDDIELDSRARQARGKDPLNADAEVHRRALEAVRLAYGGMAPLKPGGAAAKTAAGSATRLEQRSRGAGAER